MDSTHAERTTPWYQTRDGQLAITGAGSIVLVVAYLVIEYLPLPGVITDGIAIIGFGGLVVTTVYSGRAAITILRDMGNEE